jgi:hypothetical protein
MLQNKSNKIFSEINNFFTSSEKAIYRITELYRMLKISQINLGIKDLNQATYFKGDIFLAILLFPLFSIKNIQGYLSSSLKPYFEAQKDTFYRFKNSSFIKWRTVLYSINTRLIKKLKAQGTRGQPAPRCLIVDDSDLVKSGFKIEHTSKIWSHVLQKSILGFKGLFLGYWDGKSFFGLDFSLHKEKGKNKKMPFGLNNKYRKHQYKKKREKFSPGYSREKELLVNKIDNAIAMIKRALTKNIIVDYILMDSWFVCDKIIKFIRNITGDIHIIGMAKMAKAAYGFEGGMFTAKEIADKLKRRKKVKWIKQVGLYSTEVIVDYKGTLVKLFFCKTTKRGKWHLLLTTNTALGIIRAYQIYSIRWGTEIFFKESKQYFGLGKSQSRNFDAQIADTTITIIQYNIFSLAKRFTAYETIGEIFAESKDQVLELTIAQRLWLFILELLKMLANLFDSDINDLIIKIINTDNNNNKLIKLMQYQFLEAA